MEHIHPQYTFDNTGNPVGVFLSIDDWNTIAEDLRLDLPDWQKKALDIRLETYKNNPSEMLDWDEVAAQFDKEDEL